jgi:hypothetical protein
MELSGQNFMGRRLTLSWLRDRARRVHARTPAPAIFPAMPLPEVMPHAEVHPGIAEYCLMQASMELCSGREISGNAAYLDAVLRMLAQGHPLIAKQRRLLYYDRDRSEDACIRSMLDKILSSPIPLTCIDLTEHAESLRAAPASDGSSDSSSSGDNHSIDLSRPRETVDRLRDKLK